ncbi:response regulator transcription factor [Corynebacterium glyciniphilum]|uniref:response regulator n=1 Tax=Corynebacterium glyciniphilum TaxID=1404244 RepID=UPI00264E6917|nr:response regulator transcription factor [Corynebacterium glyciniphilum]MDN6706618.1 response regulator transcription factor [Corynebacterium glyciniphilum]
MDETRSTSTITVGLADDQQLVRAGFGMVLDSQPDITVVWQAVDGAEAVNSAMSSPVDMILMDVQMPELDGIAATRKIVDAGVTGPSGEPTRVVVLTTFDNDEYVMGSITAGASGFLLKDADPEELIDAVRTVGEAEAVISPKATARLLRQVRGGAGTGEQVAAATPQASTGSGADTAAAAAALDLPDPLTPRELEILVLVARGYSNPEIARRLFVSLPTVKTHVGRILAKTDSRDRVHAVLFAFSNGLVDPVRVLEE